MHQAAEAIVNLRPRTKLDVGRDHSLSDVVIADDIARADDHSERAFRHSDIGALNLLGDARPGISEGDKN